MVLTSNQVIQIDATVITGILILLTLSGFVEGTSEGKGIPIGNALIVLIIIPFSLSATYELVRSYSNIETKNIDTSSQIFY